MPSPCGRCLWIASCLLATVAGVVRGQSPPDLEVLVRQLGDDAYAARHQAADELAAVGLPARDALVAGLQSRDPEVRRRCRWILADVLEADFQRRLAAFVADREESPDHGLPRWSRYRQLIGSDAASRRLFVQMQRAEAVLLEATADGGKPAGEALGLRLAQVFQATVHPNPRRQHQPSPGTVAALLWAASDRQVEIPPQSSVDAYLVSLCQQGEFHELLADREGNAAARRLVGQWVLRPAQPEMTFAKLNLAVQYEIKEGAVAAVRMLRSSRKVEGHERAMAVAALGRLGGKDYAAILQERLDDRTHVASAIVGNKQMQTEVRDVVLAWLVHLTGQDHAAYGQDQAKEDFAEMRRFAFHTGNVGAYGFVDKAARDKALKKWKAHVAQHPLPAPPAIDKEDAPPAKEPVEETAEPAAEEPEEPPSREQGVPLPPALREHVRALVSARQCAAQGQYGRAVRLLDGILALQGDSVFAADPEIPLLQSLHGAAERAIGELPVEGRRAYEDQCGFFARQALRQAVATAEAGALANVATRYFHTQAGAEAAYLSAVGLADRLQPLQAAVALTRIRDQSHHADRFEPALSLRLAKCWGDAGLGAAADDVLRSLQQRRAGRPLAIGGQRREMAARPEHLRPWFEAFGGALPPIPASGSWLLYRGGPARNAAGESINPDLRAEPLQVMCDNAVGREIVDKLGQEQRADFRATLPKLHPLVVDKALVVRTVTHLVARDLADGRLLWEMPLDDPLRGLFPAAEPREKPRSTSRIARVLRQVAENLQDDHRGHRLERLRFGLQARCWEDSTFGTLSSDGRRVFGVEDVALSSYADEPRSVVGPDGRRHPSGGPLQKHNLLTAYDLRTGKLAWEIGGRAGSQREAAGTLFLGPPLPLGGRLFAVADVDRETRLLELDAASGAVRGSITLGVRERPFSESETDPFSPAATEDFTSRRSGAACSYFDGLLVCHTGENQFVAVDLAARTIRWAYQAPPPEPPSEESMAAVMRFALRELTGALADDRWTDGSVTVAAGCAVLTPPDRDEVICVRLVDGQWQWSAPRRDGRYVAGVYDGRVLIVGRSHVWALGLADGKLAWKHEYLPLPTGAVPSGRGFLAGDRYYLPVGRPFQADKDSLERPFCGGEIVAIDLRQGRIASRSRAADGVVPGNLIACQGAVFSQSATGVHRFESLAVRGQRLAEAAGQRPDDAELLRQRGSLLLCDGRIAEALQLLRRSAEIEPAPQTSRLLTDALIEGLQADFDAFRVQAEQLEPRIEPAAERARLLRELALAMQRAGHHRDAFALFLELIDVEPKPAELERFETPRAVRRDRWAAARLAESWAAANAADRAAIERLIAVGPVFNPSISGDDLESRPTARFLTYFDFHPSAQAVRLRLAAQLVEEQHWLEAEQLLRQVYYRGTRAEQNIAVDRLAALMRAAKQPPAAVWPAGRGRKSVNAKPAHLPDGRLGLAVNCEAGPLGHRVAVAFDAEERKLLGWDASGRQVWQVGLGGHFDEQFFSTDMAGQDVALTSGHLVLAWLGGRLYAVDGFGGRTTVRWDRATIEIDPLLAEMGLVGPGIRRGRFGGNPGAAGLTGTEAAPLLVTSSAVCFLKDNKLLAVDPLSGDVLWLRDDLRPESHMWGDDDLLFVVAPDADEAVVLSVRDGKELARRRVPDARDLLGPVDRCVAGWTATGDTMRLTLFDPWTQKTVVQRDFHAQARCWPLDGCEVAVLDPQGSLVVVALPSGDEILRTWIGPQPTLESFAVLRGSQQYILVANEVKPPGKGQVFLGEPGGNSMLVDGRVYAIDRQSGKQNWMTEVSGQRLQLDLPSDLPVLTFLGVGQRMDGDDVKEFCRVLCLDARTGRKLHSKDVADERSAVYTFRSDPDKGRFEVLTSLGTFTFTFTDK